MFLFITIHVGCYGNKKRGMTVSIEAFTCNNNLDGWVYIEMCTR